MSQLKKKMISILVPCYNESESLDSFFKSIFPILEKTGYNFEIVCIDDGSVDNTLEILDHWHIQDRRIKYLSFSRNFGKEKALTAAIDFASGDAVIPIDADLQDPPEIIFEMIKKWEEGFEVVNAVRISRDSDSIIKRLTANLFYKITQKISGIPIQSNVGDFRLISTAPLEAMRSLREVRRFMKGLFSWVGFKVANVYFERQLRVAGRTKYSYWKLFNFAVEGITSFSSLPLRLAGYMGFILSSLSFFYGAFLLIKTLFTGNPVPGYPSLMIVMLFIGGVQVFFIGVLGEYVSRIYDEVKNRPLYIVRIRKGF
jgi:glycosyltransferase involved in cell wall biosynthesis